MLSKEKVNILMVDDRPENMVALEVVLSDLSQNLVHADSGPQALRCLLKQEFAVILLDVSMPGMDGFETAELIRKHDRSIHTPIVFLTAIGKSEMDVFKGYSVGAVDYVFKPFVPEILKAKVRVFVDLFLMQRQIEEQAAQLLSDTQELQTLNAVNAALTAFSHAVSHDLHAPLRRVAGFVQIFMEEYGRTIIDETGQDYLRHIQAGTDQMGQIIDGLLSLSLVAREELHHAKVDLATMAHEVAANLRQSDPVRAERVEFIIAENITAVGDSRLINIALSNLLENAWKYTGRHKKATIEFGVLPGQAPDHPTTYFIRDDGAGFDPDYVKKIFDPFQRLHSVDEFPGLGIGLSTVQRIIRRHGGAIRAEGEVEKGATFYFTLGEQTTPTPPREEPPLPLLR